MPVRPVSRRVPAPTRRLVVALTAAILAPASVGCSAYEPSTDAGAALRSASVDDPSGTATSRPSEPSSSSSSSGEVAARATLLGPDGVAVGRVAFTPVEGGTRVAVAVEEGGAPNAFHGFHVHANDDPANGEGCVADPAAPPAGWFASADGHLAAPTPALAPGAPPASGEGAPAVPAPASSPAPAPSAPGAPPVSGEPALAAPATHGDHAGDLPPLLVMADGSAAAETTTDRFTVADVTGAAVVLHAAPDNTGHVPTGTAAHQYTPNSVTAVDLTVRSGNAGPRIACGVVTPA